MGNYLLIGSMGREQIVCENLLKYGHAVLIVSKYINPELIGKVEYIIYKNNRNILSYIQNLKVDSIICMDETLITEEFYKQIKFICNNVFMPSYDLLLIELHKQRTKKIVEMIDDRFINQAKLINNVEEIKQEQNKFVLKVESDYKTSIYFNEIPSVIDFSNMRVTIEKYIEGFDFTIPCVYCNGNTIYFDPVFDFPNKICKGRLKKTSGMGVLSLSETNTHKILPNLKDTKRLIANINEYIHREKKINTFFLSYQFRYDKTNDHIYFTEIDAKPGEPEFINTVYCIDKLDFANFLDKYFEGNLKQQDIHIKTTKNVLTLTVSSLGYPSNNKVSYLKGKWNFEKSFPIFWCKPVFSREGLYCQNSRFFHTLIEDKNIDNLKIKFQNMIEILKKNGFDTLDKEFFDIIYYDLVGE